MGGTCERIRPHPRMARTKVAREVLRQGDAGAHERERSSKFSAKAARRMKTSSRICLVLGIAALAWMIWTIGPAELASLIATVGPWFLVIIGLHVTSAIVESKA